MDRKQLIKLLDSPDQQQQQQPRRPLTASEAAVQAVWAAVLGVAADSLGPEESFFQAGAFLPPPD